MHLLFFAVPHKKYTSVSYFTEANTILIYEQTYLLLARVHAGVLSGTQRLTFHVFFQGILSEPVHMT